MDETYQIYVNRVARLTLPTTYQTQLQNIQKSPKFEGEKAVYFPGYSVITPPWQEDSENTGFYSSLQATQKQLLEKLTPGLMIPVPAESFHLTVADLIWDNGYRAASKENPGFDQQLQNYIRDSFQKYQEFIVQQGPIEWELVGLVIFPRALGVALVPQNEEAYEQILQLRRSIYQNRQLFGLGIQQQYYFTAHITLGYFGEISPELDRDHLAAILSTFNDHWLESEPQVLTIEQAQLRKFNDMTRFERESDWPIVKF